jgi:isocitrate dehydrogenase
MDVVIIRENEEDLYGGIEHQQTDEVVQCLKLISRPGCEKIVRYAFEFARQSGRKKVSCFTKDNIMKQTDGLFHQVFNEIAAEYYDIEHDHWIIDIGAAMLADSPEKFDVIVLPNLYGDIVSDIAAQISGSVGLAGSANIGEECAMFEAIHGSAPTIAGQNVANPSGLLQGAIQMLTHIGEHKVAEKIQNAWLRTLEDGCHTMDIYSEGISKFKLSTQEFAEAVIERLGQVPNTIQQASFAMNKPLVLAPYKRRPAGIKVLDGVDVFVHWPGSDPVDLANQLNQLNSDDIQLTMITNRGIKVWPDGFKETFCTDHWRCRFVPGQNKGFSNSDIIQLLSHAQQVNLDIVKTENLYQFDGKPAYSLGQGQ